jgi:hypothetical protein
MSEKRTTQSAVDLEQTQQLTNAAPQPVRRRLLKGSVAIPVIMTLHSGAALARTSNLVSETKTTLEEIAVDNEGNYVCAISDGEEAVDGKYDLGLTPNYEPISPVKHVSQVNTLGEVNSKDHMPDSQYRTLEEVAELCDGHGGILVSQSAYNSIAGRLLGDV